MAETDQFDIIQSIANDTVNTGSWSTSNSAEGTATGTGTMCWAEAFGVNDTGEDSLSEGDSDSSDSYALSNWDDFSAHSEGYGSFTNGWNSGNSDYETSYSMDAAGTDSTDWAGDTQSTLSFDDDGFDTLSFSDTASYSTGTRLQAVYSETASATDGGFGCASDTTALHPRHEISDTRPFCHAPRMHSLAAPTFGAKPVPPVISTMRKASVPRSANGG